LNPVGADATTADDNPLRFSFKESSDLLEIGEVAGLGFDVGMGNLISHHRFLAANFALFCHVGFLIKWGVSNRMEKKVKTNQKMGREGEDLAIGYLTAGGFKPLERNFRTRFGEIDIVATKAKEYFFIEVKTRENVDFGEPIESLPFYRVERLKKMATYYAMKKRIVDKNLHISLLGIDLSHGTSKICFIKDIVE